MSKAVEGAPASKLQGADLPFEEALQKLESIVEAMENDDLPLEMILAQYEEGTRMAQLCQSKLNEAELKIQKLEKKNSGEFVLRPHNLSQEAEED
ncbi:MAG: exodeoxyribonuclease VII small subunit [Verrucomicrobiales bacterium]